MSLRLAQEDLKVLPVLLVTTVFLADPAVTVNPELLAHLDHQDQTAETGNLDPKVHLETTARQRPELGDLKDHLAPPVPQDHLAQLENPETTENQVLLVDLAQPAIKEEPEIQVAQEKTAVQAHLVTKEPLAAAHSALQRVLHPDTSYSIMHASVTLLLYILPHWLFQLCSTNIPFDKELISIVQKMAFSIVVRHLQGIHTHTHF